MRSLRKLSEAHWMMTIIIHFMCLLVLFFSSAFFYTQRSNIVNNLWYYLKRNLKATVCNIQYIYMDYVFSTDDSSRSNYLFSYLGWSSRGAVVVVEVFPTQQPTCSALLLWIMGIIYLKLMNLLLLVYTQKYLYKKPTYTLIQPYSRSLLN